MFGMWFYFLFLLFHDFEGEFRFFVRVFWLKAKTSLERGFHQVAFFLPVRGCVFFFPMVLFTLGW